MSVEYLKVKTAGGASAQGKPRVYFTCHPDDFSRSFDKICEKLFEAQDCAVYYTPDMDFIIPEENRATDMERMNLFVIPVSLKLLTTPNRAMDFDFKYALEKHIPVLPIMTEPGLDPVYSREDKFGSRQYLDMVTTDSTAISFEEKLKKYLSAVLVDDETAKRVRAAFDAYVFLSYRKKDRHYANELMRLIHKNPICRDIAIWYDEFLTPGENFNDAIEKALEKSDLFALLVTPNLVNEKNYVQTTEYPKAKKANKDIFPVEMEATDKEELQRQYKDIPACVNTNNSGEFRRRLLDSVSRFALMENDDDPEHNFLIGLAYMEGIDVEVDRRRALELITGAAEAELLEAMRKLCDMYRDGTGVELNYKEALKWAKRTADYCIREYGAEHPDTLTALNNLAVVYSQLGRYDKALKLSIKLYTIRCRILGEEHHETLTSLGALASAYSGLGKHERALYFCKKAYKLRCKACGEEHPDTLASLNGLAVTYGNLGQHEKALELDKKVYELSCKVLGEEHPDTLILLGNLAIAYGDLGQYEQAFELHKKAYELCCEVRGEEHPDSLTALNNLALAYRGLGRYEKAFELHKESYELHCKVLGEEHPDTLISLGNLAIAYGDLGQYEQAFELLKKTYELRCKVLGEGHPYTLASLDRLAELAYFDLYQYEKALELVRKAYELRCKVFGKKQPDTIRTREILIALNSDIDE